MQPGASGQPLVALVCEADEMWSVFTFKGSRSSASVSLGKNLGRS